MRGFVVPGIVGEDEEQDVGERHKRGEGDGDALLKVEGWDESGEEGKREDRHVGVVGPGARPAIEAHEECGVEEDEGEEDFVSCC